MYLPNLEYSILYVSIYSIMYYGLQTTEYTTYKVVPNNIFSNNIIYLIFLIRQNHVICKLTPYAFNLFEILNIIVVLTYFIINMRKFLSYYININNEYIIIYPYPHIVKRWSL